MTERWPRLALAALLTFTAALYLWNLSASGYGNTFYAAAAEAGAHSWSAWFFGALDAGNFITVDKPPGALWITALSVRLFGMNSLSVLAPQALMGVAAVGVLFATVRRSVSDPRLGTIAGLVAGAVLACTPAASLMFRFNDPDALLVLLLTIAAYITTRAVQTASWRWLVAAGAVIGAAFLTKMLQGLLVLPGFAAAYLLFAQTSWRRRWVHLAAATGAVVASAGWWVLIVQLIPAQSRPYIGGSTDDSVLDLAFGYNGMARILGASTKATNTSTGLHRLFIAEMGSEISWLLPAAVFAIGFGAYSWARGGLSVDERAALVIWGSWLIVTGTVFSFMNGTVHPYYTVALAPPVGALIGLGSVWAWRTRAALDGRGALACMLGLAAGWSAILLRRNHFGPHWLPWVVISICGGTAAVVLVGSRFTRSAVAVGAAAAVTGTVAFTVATAASAHHGTIPIAVGKQTDFRPTNQALADLLMATHTPWSAATNGSQSAANLEIASGTSVMAIGGWSGGDPVPTLEQFIEDVRAGRVTYYVEAGRGGPDQPHGPVVRSQNRSAAHTREIADWVAAHYPAVTMGESLVYRLI